MKLHASTQNVFSLNTPMPFAGQWEQGATRHRARFTVRPFVFEDVPQTIETRDAIARKQEIVCAVILGLCLLFSFAVCFTQLAFL